jgi:ankyrin repeat protein
MAMTHRLSWRASLLLLGTFVCLPAQAAAASDLIESVRSGDRALVRDLLQKAADVNAAEADGTTALHWAVRADDGELIRWLLDSGASPTSSNRYGVTPLALAAINGSASALLALLEAGADPNTRGAAGETVLMRTARTGSVPALRVLVERGADVNASESWLGETALMWAAGENHGEAVRFLLEQGAQADARSKPVQFGELKYPSTGLVRMVLPRGQWTPLMFAARQGALAAARALADGGADLDAVDPDGVTALTVAILNAHYDLAAMLVERGADPNVADQTGRTALYAAVDMHTLPPMFSRPAPRPSGQLDALALAARLLSGGADPDLALSRPLLPRHHNPGDRSLGEGSTPFMRAAQAADMAMMRLLVDGGADPRLTQKNGTTALMLAASGRPAGEDEESGVPEQSGAAQAIDFCLDAGLDIHAVSGSGDTALHRAVANGAVPAVRRLLERGANPHARNAKGESPLVMADGVRSTDARSAILTLLQAAPHP